MRGQACGLGDPDRAEHVRVQHIEVDVHIHRVGSHRGDRLDQCVRLGQLGDLQVADPVLVDEPAFGGIECTYPRQDDLAGSKWLGRSWAEIIADVNAVEVTSSTRHFSGGWLLACGRGASWSAPMGAQERGPLRGNERGYSPAPSRLRAFAVALADGLFEVSDAPVGGR
jgi:hypothetical protein